MIFILVFKGAVTFPGWWWWEHRAKPVRCTKTIPYENGFKIAL